LSTTLSRRPPRVEVRAQRPGRNAAQGRTPARHGPSPAADGRLKPAATAAATAFLLHLWTERLQDRPQREMMSCEGSAATETEPLALEKG
jgi:hypothetical protein